MLVMAVLLMAGTTFLTISSTESQIALNEQGYATALTLAEAAIHKALVLLNAGSTYAGETNTALGGGTFTITFAASSLPLSRRCPTDNSKDLVATASVPVRGGQAQVQLRVTVDTVAYPYRWAAYGVPPSNDWWGLFLYSSRVDSFDSTLGPYDGTTNSAKHGNIGANGDTYLWISGVNGDIKASGDINNWSSSVSGGQTPNATSEAFPTIIPGVTPTTELYIPAARDKNNPYRLPAGNHYYTKLTMESGTKLVVDGNAKIYVTGPVDIKDGVTIGEPPGTQLQIITKSDGDSESSTTFNTGTNFTLYGSLYGKNTNINLWAGNAQVYGSVIGRMVWAWSAQFHFDQAMLNQELCQSPMYTIRRGTWREVIPST
jgi:hypothetical protein